MSTPSSWPPPPQQGPAQGGPQPSPFAEPAAGAPSPYARPTQAVPSGPRGEATQAVPAYAQPSPYGQPGQHPQQYARQQYAQQHDGPGQQLPARYQPVPRVERRLMPGVWWSLVINLVVSVGFAVLLLVLGWALVELFTGMVGEDVSWREAAGEEGVGAVVLVVGIVLVVSLLVSWGLTVLALVLWRLIRGFRTIPAFVQALVAFVSMWIVTSVLSAVAQVLFGVFGAAAGSGSTY